MKIMKPAYIPLLVIGILGVFAKCETSDMDNLDKLYPSKDAISFSQDFLLAIKSDEPYQAFIDTLARLDLDTLESELNTREEKLCFWINTYNTLVQVKVKSDTSKFDNRDRFFKTKDLIVGAEKMSLDFIEHDIIRSKSLSEFLARFQLDTLDYRIHFALNCGAAACPPIAFYHADKIDEELELAEEVFIKNTSTFDENSGILETSKILDWYSEDFGGRDGIIKLMRKHDIIKDQEVKMLKFTPYDWTLDLNNY